MKILVVIVTYNAMRWAKKCFDSLRMSRVKVDVFVVDNGSTDGTQEFIKKQYPEIVFQQSNENLGFGRANNLGLKYAKDNKYDFVYLLNQDAWIFPETIEELIKISIRNPEYGILSPFQMEANMQHIDKGFKVNVCSWSSNNNILDYLYLGTNMDVYDVKEVMAAHWFITKKCLEKVGGFSPTFPHYGEDKNFIDRACYFGFNVGIVPSLKVVHDRENRPESKSKILHLIYTSILGQMSDPNNKKSNYFMPLLECLYRYKSFKPITYLFEILKNKKEILRNREISMQSDCAFL